MEDIILEMEDCSSRIDDPTYPEGKDIEQGAFFGVFFCYLKEESSC
jgi:hypothetical protein